MVNIESDSVEGFRSIGIFSSGEPNAAFSRHRERLVKRVGMMTEEDRPLIANYLRRGATVFAAMEHTRDLIGGIFERPGGSAILTDGEYYWRRDCADYVEHYGIGLPQKFLEHIRKLNWETPAVSKQRILDLDHFLMNRVTP
jgi:hypothetical protein